MEGEGGVEAHIYSYRTQRWPRKLESVVEFAVEFVTESVGRGARGFRGSRWQ
jgi:hypothetical protein